MNSATLNPLLSHRLIRATLTTLLTQTTAHHEFPHDGSGNFRINLSIFAWRIK